MTSWACRKSTFVPQFLFLSLLFLDCFLFFSFILFNRHCSFQCLIKCCKIMIVCIWKQNNNGHVFHIAHFLLSISCTLSPLGISMQFIFMPFHPDLLLNISLIFFCYLFSFRPQGFPYLFLLLIWEIIHFIVFIYICDRYKWVLLYLKKQTKTYLCNLSITITKVGMICENYENFIHFFGLAEILSKSAQ